jgi:hypothetical protein
LDVLAQLSDKTGSLDNPEALRLKANINEALVSSPAVKK